MPLPQDQMGSAIDRIRAMQAARSGQIGQQQPEQPYQPQIEFPDYSKPQAPWDPTLGLTEKTGMADTRYRPDRFEMRKAAYQIKAGRLPLEEARRRGLTMQGLPPEKPFEY